MKNILTLSLSFCALAVGAQNTQSGKDYLVKLGATDVKYHAIDKKKPLVNLLGGSLKVGDVEYMIYLPESGPYNLKNTNTEDETPDILIFSNAAKVCIDYNRDGKIGEGNGECWAANHAIRFGNSMLDVKSISKDGKTMVLTDSKAEVNGLVVGRPAPDFEFADEDGKVHRLKDYRGKYLVLDLWSVTCGPCQQNMPNVLELQKQFGEDKLNVLLMSMDKGWHLPDVEKRNKETIGRIGVPWPNVLMPNAWNVLVKKFNTHGYGLWMINPEGTVVVAGPGHDMDAIRAALK